jgi:hypothetical protein
MKPCGGVLTETPLDIVYPIPNQKNTFKSTLFSKRKFFPVSEKSNENAQVFSVLGENFY